MTRTTQLLTMRVVVLVVWVGVAAAGVAAIAIATWALARERRHGLLGQYAAWLAPKFGPIGVKLAQVASARGDIFPLSFLSPLRQLQDSVPNHTRSMSIQDVLEEAYGMCLPFAHVSPEPFAAGTIADLHTAWLGEQRVVLKIVRPEVEQVLTLDFTILERAAMVLAKLPALKGIPVVEALGYFRTAVLSQCDMEGEAKRALQHIQRPCIETQTPLPIFALTRRNVLVMQFLPHTAKIDGPLSLSVYRRACLTLLRDLYRMIFVFGSVHGDLHPGNVAVAADGRVVLYDFGLVSVLTDSDKSVFRRFFGSVVASDAAGATDALLESANRRMSPIEDKSIRGDMTSLLDKHANRRAGTFSVVTFVAELFVIQRRHRIYSAPGFSTAVWALAMYEGLVKEKFPELDFQAIARAFLVSTQPEGIANAAERLDMETVNRGHA